MAHIKGLLQDIREGIDRENIEYSKQIAILKEELKELDHVDTDTEYFDHRLHYHPVPSPPPAAPEPQITFNMGACHPLKPKTDSAARMAEVSGYFTPGTFGTVTQCCDDVRQAGHNGEEGSRDHHDFYSFN